MLAWSVWLLLSGCTTLSVDGPAGAGGRRTYVGLVTVEMPLDSRNTLAVPQVRQIDFTTIGLRIEHGVSLGYLKDRVLNVPMDCRLVVFVRSPMELDHAERVLRALSKEEPCVVKFSE